MKILIYICFILSSLTGLSQEIKWDKPIRCGTDCRSVTRDSNNDFYFSGQINTAIHNQKYFDNDSLPMYNQYYNYCFIAKTDKEYRSKWIKIIESNGFFEPMIRIDSENNLVLIGLYNATVKIDSFEFSVPAKKQKILIAKFDSEGKLIWHNSLTGGIGGLLNTDLKIDSDNNIYIAGDNVGTTTYYNNNVIDTIAGIGEEQEEQIFFAKYNSYGQFDWAKTLPLGHSQIGIRAIEIDRKKNIYLTGWWSDGGMFDSVPKISISSDIFIAKYDSTRKLQWLKQLGVPSSTTFQSATALALDEKLNSIYVTGGFLGSVDFGGKIVQANDNNIFLARYSLQGNLVWVKNMGSWSGASSSIEHGKKLMVDDKGFIYLSGILGKNGNFDGITISAYDNPLNSNVDSDFFIAKYTATGQLLWITHAGTPDDDDEVNDLLKDKENNLFVVGNTSQVAIFGDYKLEGTYPIGFISKIFDHPVGFLNISRNNLTFDADKNLMNSFEIVSDLNWQISFDAPWLSANSLSGSGNSIITLVCNKNLSSQIRNAVLKVTTSTGIENQININQGGNVQNSGFLNISPISLTFDASKNLTNSFEIISDLNWQVSFDAPWLSANSLSGFGNRIITLVCSKNSSSQTRSAILKITSSTGIEKEINVSQGYNDLNTDNEDFLIYPNPVNSIIYFSPDSELINANITILDVTGKILIQGRNTSNQFNVESLKNGIYLLLIKDSKHQFVRKFIKK